MKYSELMHLYRDEIANAGQIEYPDLPENQQVMEAEQDFYDYLTTQFFRQSNSLYCVWELEGHYKAALRLEPFRDGLIICALHTDLMERKKGYAKKLLCEVQEIFAKNGSICLYSHVSKNNPASLMVHKACGFHIIKDNATYLDGSVDYASYTLVYK